MNEELQKVLTEMLNKASDGIGAAKNFLEAEIPEVVTQLLLWHGVVNFLWMVWSVTSLIMVFILVKKVLSTIKASGFKCTAGDYDENPTVELLESVARGLAALIFMIIGLETMNVVWLQIWIAPKIFIIEYIASLAK